MEDLPLRSRKTQGGGGAFYGLDNQSINNERHSAHVEIKDPWIR